LPTISETTTAFTNLSSNTSPEKESYGNGLNKIESDLPTCDVSSVGFQGGSPVRNPIRRKPQGSTDSKRERKAAKTLGIITGYYFILSYYY
jgi:hypothetical protein